MLGFAVIAESFAVISDDGDKRPIELAALFEGGDEPGDTTVDVRDFAVVGRSGECCLERRGWVVRRVGVVEMNPREPGTGRP